MTTAILVILFAHFFGDFVMQKQAWALNKWHSNKALGSHVLMYTTCLFLFVWLCLVPEYGQDTLPYFAGWALINGFFHFFIDYATSRDMHQYREEGDKKLFFDTYGFDQMLHYAILFITYTILVNFII